ncbi:MAG: ATP-binding protein [Bacteroidales bacterium]|jgi:signal transduction histidine kinase/ligand-binding sensor domain-containing protein/AraC-like DNA-binding protein|nr:ATP-binding protein [Bacteroidales bacterium]
MHILVSKKNKFTVFLSVLVLMLLLPFYAAGSGGDYRRFETIPLGADASVANCFAQDSTGLIWIGTNRGLYSFDGYTTKSHSDVNEPSYTQIYCALVKGRYLYLGSDNGLLVYDYINDRYIDVISFNNLPRNIRSLALDGNKLWIGSINGLFRYDFSCGRLDTVEKGLPHKAVYSILVSQNRTVYVGTYNGLCRYDRSSGSFSVIPVPASNRKNNIFVNSLLEDVQRNCIWIGTEGNLYKYSLLDKSVSSISMFADNSVKSLALDNPGNLITGTDNGLYVYDGNSGKHYVHDSRDKETISNDVVWSVFVDRGHNLWLGTEYNISLSRNGGGKRIIPISELTGTGEGNRFYSIFRDSRGFLWLGGTNGLIRYDGKTEKSLSYKMSDKKYPVPHNRIRDIYEDSEHNLWVATDGSIIRYDYRKKQFYRYSIVDSTRTLNANWAYNIFEDSLKRLWVGAYLGGVFVMDRNDLLSSGASSCVAIRNFSAGKGLPGSFINQMIEGKNGDVWILLYKGGIYKIDALSWEIERVDIESRTGEMPECMLADDEGNIWCGFGGGVAVLSYKGRKCSVIKFGDFNRSDVLSMEQVGDAVWISTSEGVWTVGKDLEPRRLDLGGDPYTCIYYDKNADTVYLGGVDEIAVTTPAVMKKRHEAMPVFITGFSVNDKPYVNGRTGIRYSDRFDLKYNQNHLYFEFSDLNYSPDRKSRFICRMEGIDKDWTLLPVSINHVSYANLKYGNYSLIVNTLNATGLPGRNPKSVCIKIHPPWYYTLFAKIIYGLFLLGLAAWILNFFRVRNNLRIERIEKEKTLEQSKLKMDFFANISHEFKTPLSLIMAPVEKLLSEIKEGRHAALLESIRQNAVKLNSLIHRAMDFNRLDENPDDLFIPSKVDIVEFCGSIFAVYKDNFEDKSFLFKSDMGKIYASVDVVKMESVVNNIVSNACKYTPAGGTITMKLENRSDEGKIKISVSDNGVGIPENEIPYIFQRFYQSSRTAGEKSGTGIGLYLARSYVEMHNGSITAFSGKSGGTTITIVLPVSSVSAEPVLPENKAVTPGHVSGRRKIAVIDDNIAITDFIKETLSGEYVCEVAHNGKAGLYLCRSMYPDLIIADLMMPVMDGLEMCKRIKSDGRLSLIPIILLTAKGDRETELASINLNIDVFMPKPFEASILLSRVRQLLRSKEQIESKVRIEKIATPEKIEVMSYDEKFLSDITRIIEDNIADPALNVLFVCEKANVNQKQLYRKIKLLTGSTPVEYIKQIRLKKAAMLLKQRRFTVSEVMYMVGFSSSSYFSKCFQNHFGKTPRQFADENNTES